MEQEIKIEYPIDVTIQYDYNGKIIPYENLSFTQDGDAYNTKDGLIANK